MSRQIRGCLVGWCCVRSITPRTGKTAALAALLVCFLGSLAPAVAQPQDEKDKARVTGVFPPAPSDVRRPLARARRAIEEGRHSDAAYELGALLARDAVDEAEAQDYFLTPAEDGKPRTENRLKAELQRLLAALPREGREAYELQYGAQARALLDAALAERDFDKLYTVIRKFLHTRAGYEASLAAGRYELARGAPSAAALHLQRIAEAPDAQARFDPELSLLMAACWLQARLPDKATETLLALKRRSPQLRVRLGTQETELFRDDAAALVWLKSLMGEGRPVAAAIPADWPMFRGNAQRNARTRGTPPLANFRWLVPTPIDREDEKTVEKVAKQLRDEGCPALPVVQPLAVGPTLIMRTPTKILGVDFHSGKRIWVWPPWDEDVEPRDGGGRLSHVRKPASEVREQELRQRLWEDAAYGQISSEGQSVFLLHDLGYAATGATMHQQIIFAGGGFRMGYPGAPRGENQLVSLSVARQGAAQWIVGGESGEDEPRLARTFFLGPPLPLDGKLYVLAECSGEIRLVALDAKNGRLQWLQQLANVDERTIVTDGMRRLAGASPSYDGGVLLCPTSAGALVAVDVATRSLLWGYPYSKQAQSSPQQPMMFMHGNRGQQRPLGQRWADTTVTVAEGRVLLTALETDDLHCLDLLTGKPVWPPQERKDRLYLACVHEGKAVFVGVNQVTALSLADGKPAWSKPVDLTDPPSGRGAYSLRSYFLPTAGSELLQIDLDKGEVISRTATALVLGNLVCFQDQIVSQGPSWLSTHYQNEPLRARVRELLAKNPHDAEALARHGELLLQEGKRAAALAAFRRVGELNPDDDMTRSLLVDTLLAGLRENFAAHGASAAELDRLIERPAQRSEYLRLLARGWQAQGKTKEAFEAYLKLADLRCPSPVDGMLSPPEPERIDRHWSVRTDRWLQARLGELIATADAAQRAQLDEAIRPFLESAMTGGDVPLMRQFLAYFGMQPSADQVRLKLASRLITDGLLLEAELLLTRLDKSPNPSLRPAATAELARLLLRGRQFEQAVAVYRQLAERWGDTVCGDGKTGKQLQAAALSDPQVKENLEGLCEFPYGRIEATEGADQTNQFAGFRRTFSSTLYQRQGPAPEGLRLSYDQNRNLLVVQDGWGQTLLNMNLGNRRPGNSDFSLAHARVHGHLLVVSLGTEVVAVDLLQGGGRGAEVILWRQELLRQQLAYNPYQPALQVRPLKHPWGGSRRVFADQQQRLVGRTAWVQEDGVYFQHLRELVCVDPVSGARVWERENLPQGCDVFGDDELIFAVAADADTARVFSAVDGRDLGERKVEKLENRWAVYGRNVLAWNQSQPTDPLQLRLYDAWTGRDIWREQLPPETRGTLVDCDEVAWVSPDSKLTIRSLRDDRVRIGVALAAPEPKLTSLHALRARDHYIVATNRAEQKTNPQTAEVQFGFSSYAYYNALPLTMLTGHVYALERSTGKSLWKNPVAIEQYGFPTDQPAESPVLMFLRFLRPDGQRTARTATGLLCLDRRDGRAVLQRNDLPQQMQAHEMVADRRKQNVMLWLPGKSYTLRFTGQPWPPEPPPAPAAKPEAKAETKPEAKAETKPEAKAETKPEAKAETKPPAKAGTKPPAKAEAKPNTAVRPQLN